VVADDEEGAARADGGGQPAVQCIAGRGREVHELGGDEVELLGGRIP
jgi:hypothetical protein